MSMWFYDESGEMEEYQSLKIIIRTVEREYLELRDLLRDAQAALGAPPHTHEQKVRVNYLDKRVKDLEEKYPWLLWETPIEMALFSPPHG